jgi:Phospholipase_D-nuclease N-terminal
MADIVIPLGSSGLGNFHLLLHGYFFLDSGRRHIEGLEVRAKVGKMLFLQEGFTFRNFLVDALTIFVFIVWFWLLITVTTDLFRRHDISGWAKAIWVIALIVAPYIGVLAYLILQGGA